MASALNRRLDQPHFGPFAITPRRLAARRREQAEGLAFPRTHSDGGSQLEGGVACGREHPQCWEYQGTANAVLDYEQFATTATHTAVDCIGEMDTTSKRLTEYTIDADTSVAVVGFKQLTELERSILPSDYETVDPFTEESFNYPPFRILDSPAAIVDAVLHTVTPENANDVAVVLDAASQYSSLIESALEAADIPYYGGPGFTDNSSHRAFLQLLRHAHAGREILVWVTSDHYSSSSDWWWISSMTRNDSVIRCARNRVAARIQRRHRSSYPRLGTRQVRDSYWKFAGRLPRGTRAAWNSRRHRHRAGGRPPRVLSSVVRGPHRP